MKKKILNALKYLLFLSLGFGLLEYLIFNQGKAESGQVVGWTDFSLIWETVGIGWNKIKTDLGHADYTWVTFALIAALLSHFIRAVRWRLLIRPLGYNPSVMNVFLAVMIGYFMNLVVPRMGEISKCISLGKNENIPTNKLLGSIIVERLFDVICLLILIFITFIAQIETIGAFFSAAFGDSFSLDKIGAPQILLIIGVLGLGFAGFKFGPKILFNLIQNSKYFFKVKKLIIGLTQGLKSFKNLESRKEFLLHTFLIWFLYFLMVYLCFPAYMPTVDLGPLAGLSALAIGSLGIVAPVQGGIGAYHWCVQKLLTLYGISEDNGLTFAFIVHTAQTLLLIVFGAISLVLLPVFSKQKKSDG